MRLLAELMPSDACFARLETGFPSVDRRFLMVRFEKASFRGVYFCLVLECSLGFASCSSAETVILGFCENEHRATMRNQDRFLGNSRIATRENKGHDFKSSIKHDN